jgi:hypothetical protein
MYVKYIKVLPYSFLCPLIKYLFCYQELVFIGPLPSSGCPSIVEIVTPGICLPTRCLAMGMALTTSCNALLLRARISAVAQKCVYMSQHLYVCLLKQCLVNRLSF